MAAAGGTWAKGNFKPAGGRATTSRPTKSFYASAARSEARQDSVSMKQKAGKPTPTKPRYLAYQGSLFGGKVGISSRQTIAREGKRARVAKKNVRTLTGRMAKAPKGAYSPGALAARRNASSGAAIRAKNKQVATLTRTLDGLKSDLARATSKSVRTSLLRAISDVSSQITAVRR